MTQTTPLILPFSEINARDLGLVGGKGANLGEMLRADFPVPPGFCVTTFAFEKFIAATPNADELYTLLDTIKTDDLDSMRVIGERVRQSLLKVPIPKEIAEAVKQAWQGIGIDDAYAVRSSATAEDLPDASFAGQQDTYLNIIGEDALLDAVRRCWVSLFTDRAILYRMQNDFDHRDVQLSVVVQKMILSEKSGTLFTANPLTGHRHTLTIDASFGLGEALVSGLVTPDAYKVDKRTMKIIERQVSEKEVAIFPEKDGGTRQVTLDVDRRKQAALTDDQILKLAELGTKIESHYGSPQDIEWAIADDEIYLLQTRPITSLYPIDGLKSPDESLHVFFSMGHQQNMTRAMPLLSLTTFPNFIPSALRADDGTVPILRFSGGRLFIDVTEILRHPLGKRGFPKAMSQFDLLAPQLFKLVTQRPEFKRPHKLRFALGMLKGIFGGFRRVFQGLWRRDLDGFVAQTNILIDEFIADAERELREAPKGKAQVEAMLSALETPAPFFINWVPEAAAGIASARLLSKLASRWLSPEKVEALTLGIPGNVVNEMNLMLSDLAELARKSPELVDAFENLGDDAHFWLEDIAKLESSASFLEGWRNFLSLYGARAQSEIDLSMKRWCEEPLPVLRVIAGNIEKNFSSRALFEKQVRERETVYAELLTAAGRGGLGGLRTRLFKRLYHVLVEVGGCASIINL